MSLRPFFSSEVHIAEPKIKYAGTTFTSSWQMRVKISFQLSFLFSFAVSYCLQNCSSVSVSSFHVGFFMEGKEELVSPFSSRIRGQKERSTYLNFPEIGVGNDFLSVL